MKAHSVKGLSEKIQKFKKKLIFIYAGGFYTSTTTQPEPTPYYTVGTTPMTTVGIAYAPTTTKAVPTIIEVVRTAYGRRRLHRFM
jgi:hypothetical protein